MTPLDNLYVRLTPGSADRQHSAAKVRWPTGEPPVASEPVEIDETLRELARLDPVELGQQAVLEGIVQAAATAPAGWACCCSTVTSSCATWLPQGGPDAPWRVHRCDLAKARRWTHSCRMRRLRARILPVSHAGPTSAHWQ